MEGTMRMKRRWNVSLLLGFLLILAAFVTYIAIFIRFPLTRDIPWVTYLIFAAGLALLVRGLVRAYREPRLYRGRIGGPILLSLGLALIGFFGYTIHYGTRQIPVSANAPRPGEKAPDFALPDQDGVTVSLSGLLAGGTSGAEKINGVVLIFYRGYW